MVGRAASFGVFFSISLLSLACPSIQHYSIPPPSNPRLEKAYIALQAWRHSITDDPNDITANWCGPDVCNYTGVFCAPALDDPHVTTVAGIDINHGNVAGNLPEEIGLLSDLSLFHINTNRFSGVVPASFRDMHLLFELDLSNNRFYGPFPHVVLEMPTLRFLDLRFNRFSGKVPKSLFKRNLDAIFLNNNQFRFTLPENIGNSPVSVLVLADIDIGGGLPRSLAKMADTLEELIIRNASVKSCIPPEIGHLRNLKLLDLSRNRLVGELPVTLGRLKNLEVLDVSHNRLSGMIHHGICQLPRLSQFIFSDNYFCSVPDRCLKIKTEDDRENCIPNLRLQRSVEECQAILYHPVRCCGYGCLPPPPPPPSPPPPSPLPPPYPY